MAKAGLPARNPAGREGGGAVTKPVDEDEASDVVTPHPRPVNILPDEGLSLQQAAFYSGRSERELRRELGPRYGISGKIIQGGRIEFSAPCLQLVLQARFDLLEIFRDGHRDHPEVTQLFFEFGIPGAELQTAIIAWHRAGLAAKGHRALVPPPFDMCDPPAKSSGPRREGRRCSLASMPMGMIARSNCSFGVVGSWTAFAPPS